MNNKIRGIINIILSSIIVICIFKIIELKKFEYDIGARVVYAYNDLKSNNTIDIDKYDKYIIVEGDNIDKELVELLKTNISLIPKSISDKFFEEKGGKVILTSKNLSKSYYNGDVKGNIIGLHNGNENIIYIEANDVSINNATLHEFGHELDALTGWTSRSDKNIISDIYNEEKDNFKTYSTDEHYKLNETEYLAQAFMEYILDKEKLKLNSPKTYNYIENLINKTQAS